MAGRTLGRFPNGLLQAAPATCQDGRQEQRLLEPRGGIEL
jgi:hypothetical protein